MYICKQTDIIKILGSDYGAPIWPSTLLKITLAPALRALYIFKCVVDMQNIPVVLA